MGRSGGSGLSSHISGDTARMLCRLCLEVALMGICGGDGHENSSSSSSLIGSLAVRIESLRILCDYTAL